LLYKLIGELEVQMNREELILFSAIRRGGKAGIEAPIAAMRVDHDDRGTDIARIPRVGLACRYLSLPAPSDFRCAGTTFVRAWVRRTV
jgi:iron-sulfur cluster repair protein YtfE (RIC family)